MTRQYVNKVLKSEVGMRPVIPLPTPLDLGFVGTVSDDGVYSHRGTIQAMLGLNSIGRELPPQDSSLSISVTSGRAVKVGFRASASTDGTLAQFGDLAGKATISFGAADGFFLAVNGWKIRQLAEPQLLINAILTGYRQGVWEKDWVFIHQLGIAKSMTAILSSEKDTTVLVKASTKVAAGAAAEADLAAGFNFVASTKAVTQVVGKKNVTAFYGAYRVKDTAFSEPCIERFLLRDAFGLEMKQYSDAVARPANTSMLKAL